MIRTEPNYLLEISALQLEIRRLRELCRLMLPWVPAGHSLINTVQDALRREEMK